jgi:hypothetical protein
VGTPSSVQRCETRRRPQVAPSQDQQALRPGGRVMFAFVWLKLVVQK